MTKQTLSIDKINERISDRGIRLVGKYVTNKNKTMFRCGDNHEWSARPDAILAGKGCPICYNINKSQKQQLTKEEVNKRLFERGIVLIGEYNTNKNKTLFKCKANHEWIARPDNVLNGSSCIYCPRPPKPGTGGFKKHLRAWRYVLEFDTFLKFGITNVPKNRLSQHKASGVFVVRLLEECKNGEEAVRWEQHIKGKYGGRYVGSDIMKTGHTETLPKEVLNDIIH